MKKGISNYYLDSQEQFDKLLSLNGEVRCDSIDFDLIDPIEIEAVEELTVSEFNYKACLKYSLNKVKQLTLQDLSTGKIKSILTRIKRIDKLKIFASSLESIDFRPFKIKELLFRNISFKGSFYFPKEVDKLVLYDCKPLNLVKAQRVNEIHILGNYVDPEDCKEFFKTLKGVKIAKIPESLGECLTSLPSTVREINIGRSSYEPDNLEEIVAYFPYFIKSDNSFPIKAQDRSKMRIIDPIMTSTEEKFSLRPRKIKVIWDNATQLNNHPELFEKVEHVDTYTDEFNLDVLPREIKKIEIHRSVDIESKILNRLEKECE